MMPNKSFASRPFLLSLIFSALVAQQGLAETEKVIYGEDNRVDVSESDNDLFVELSKSTAAMIPHASIVTGRQDKKADIQGKTLKENGVCAEERFSSQITAARCSGFLVGPDLLVTAGHCVRDQWDCKNYSWVFDYKIDPDNPKVVRVPVSSVYRCQEIIAQTLDYTTQDDYALIRLEKAVTDRTPLNFRREGAIEEGASLVVIGHPSGLPTKIADGATVRSVGPAAYFIANLDTYGGNSGSAVLDAETGVVEGILVRGEADYEMSPGRSCRISKLCPADGCRGEDVTRITNIKELQSL